MEAGEQRAGSMLLHTGTLHPRSKPAVPLQDVLYISALLAGETLNLKLSLNSKIISQVLISVGHIFLT